MALELIRGSYGTLEPPMGDPDLSVLLCDEACLEEYTSSHDIVDALDVEGINIENMSEEARCGNCFTKLHTLES